MFTVGVRPSRIYPGSHFLLNQRKHSLREVNSDFLPPPNASLFSSPGNVNQQNEPTKILSRSSHNRSQPSHHRRRPRQGSWVDEGRLLSQYSPLKNTTQRIKLQTTVPFIELHFTRIWTHGECDHLH